MLSLLSYLKASVNWEEEPVHEVVSLGALSNNINDNGGDNTNNKNYSSHHYGSVENNNNNSFELHKQDVLSTNRQRNASIILSLCYFSHGYFMTLSSLVISNTTFLISTGVEISQISSFINKFIIIFYFGEVIGSVLSFPFSETFGRKYTILYSLMIGVVLFVLNCVSFSFQNILTLRFLIGLILGVLLSTVPVFISEISTEDVRGRNVGFIFVSMIIGCLSSCIVYAILGSINGGWRISLILPILILMTQLALTIFMPDSPRWLLASKTPAECLISMRRWRQITDVSKEFNLIYRALTSDARLGDDCTDLFIQSKSVRIRILITILIQVLQQIVGFQVISVYGKMFLNEIGIENSVFGMSLALLSSLIGAILFILYVDKIGRRKLLLSGCCIMSLSWYGCFLCVNSSGVYNNNNPSLAIYAIVIRSFFGFFLCLFSFSYCFSFGPIAWLLSAEIFPYRARAKASSVTTAVHFGSAVVGLTLIDFWSQWKYSTHNCLVIALAISLIVTLFIYLAIPETKEIMLEDMEELFKIDQSSYCCGCFPELRSGVLGLRVLNDDQKSINKIFNTSNSTRNNKQMDTSENANNIFVEPSTLHKYSNDMRETKFSYFDEDDIVVVPSFNINRFS